MFQLYLGALLLDVGRVPDFGVNLVTQNPENCPTMPATTASNQNVRSGARQARPLPIAGGEGSSKCSCCSAPFLAESCLQVILVFPSACDWKVCCTVHLPSRSSFLVVNFCFIAMQINGLQSSDTFAVTERQDATAGRDGEKQEETRKNSHVKSFTDDSFRAWPAGT
mmetsp:Transcript_39807/g.80251  ORF Transcript_39807/g.80251 Transcript_39807/m.80251 type:complete len:167 (+) Transcript_39807:176-676(+)